MIEPNFEINIAVSLGKDRKFGTEDVELLIRGLLSEMKKQNLISREIVHSQVGLRLVANDPMDGHGCVPENLLALAVFYT